MTRLTRYLALPLLILGASQALAADRVSTAATFTLTLDGVPMGFLKSVGGGGAFAEVVLEQAQPNSVVRKHINTPKYENFEVQTGLTNGSQVYDWIANTWSMKTSRKNGALVACDFKQDAVQQHEFFNALLTETTFPALDAASKDAGYLTLKFAPELVRTKPASGKCAVDAGKMAAKGWLPSNFRLELQGLDTTGVVKIDSFTVSQRPVNDSLGNSRDSVLEAGKLTFPNLELTVNVTRSKTWEDWFEDFVIKGNNGSDREKSGVIVLLATNRTEELARVDLKGVGIYRLARDTVEANTDGARNVRVGLYVESMSLQVGKAQRKVPSKGAIEKAAPRPAKR